MNVKLVPDTLQQWNGGMSLRWRNTQIDLCWYAPGKRKRNVEQQGRIVFTACTVAEEVPWAWTQQAVPQCDGPAQHWPWHQRIENDHRCWAAASPRRDASRQQQHQYRCSPDDRIPHVSSSKSPVRQPTSALQSPTPTPCGQLSYHQGCRHSDPRTLTASARCVLGDAFPVSLIDSENRSRGWH